MTQRYNDVQLRVVEAIMKHSKMKRKDINESKAIAMKEGMEELKGISLEQFAKLRSDICYWVREKDAYFQEV
jgi:hypothetical protein